VTCPFSKLIEHFLIFSFGAPHPAHSGNDCGAF
jgi:hypothetical protein